MSTAAAVSILALTGIASAPISAQTFVTHADAPAGAAANTKGVARSDAASGAAYPVDVLGTAVVLSGAAVAVGDALQTDASARAITRTSTNPVVARALSAATGANQGIEVLLIPN
jgi:hypothetical protein